jgi:hypothetical protein
MLRVRDLCTNGWIKKSLKFCLLIIKHRLAKIPVRCNGTHGLMQCHLYDFWLEIYLTKVSCVLIRLQIDRVFALTRTNMKS